MLSAWRRVLGNMGHHPDMIPGRRPEREGLLFVTLFFSGNSLAVTVDPFTTCGINHPSQDRTISLSAKTNKNFRKKKITPIRRLTFVSPYRPLKLLMSAGARSFFTGTYILRLASASFKLTSACACVKPSFVIDLLTQPSVFSSP
jgi:hypothetical protein